jgi:single-strand DNA-binding protein
MLSQTIMMGFVASDPELKENKDKQKVCKFNLAVDRPFRAATEAPKADFFRIETWGSHGEFLFSTLKKGERIVVHCRAKNRSYMDKNNLMHYITIFVASEVFFAGTKKLAYLAPPPLDMFECPGDDPDDREEIEP